MIPGLAAHPQKTSVAPAASAAAPDPSKESSFRVGHSVSAPRVIHHRDPKFSAAADQVKWQGIVALKLIVDQTGVPKDIRVVRPLGCGLDAEAVRTAELWRFKPAENDGRPVAVEIALEMDFRRY